MVYMVGEGGGRKDGRTALTDSRGRRMGDEERDVITLISAAIVPSPLNPFRSIWQPSFLHINQVRGLWVVFIPILLLLLSLCTVSLPLTGIVLCCLCSDHAIQPGRHGEKCSNLAQGTEQGPG